MSHHSLYSRVVVFTLVLCLSGFVHTAASLAQDISGGASFATDISGGANVLLASADIEAKLGKGIFSRPQNRAHAPKALEKKTVVRSAHLVRPQRETTASNKTERNNSRNNSRDNSRNNSEGAKPVSGESSKPLGDAAKRVPVAEDFHRQGDDFFDAGQYQKAIDAYQQSIRMRANYPEAYLNLGEAYFNLGRYDDAVTAEKQAIQQKPDLAAPYHALGLAFLKLDRSADSL